MDVNNENVMMMTHCLGIDPQVGRNGSRGTWSDECAGMMKVWVDQVVVPCAWHDQGVGGTGGGAMSGSEVREEEDQMVVEVGRLEAPAGDRRRDRRLSTLRTREL